MNSNNNELNILKSEIQRLRVRIDELNNLAQNVTVPIIPSIIPDTLLIPIFGSLTTDRFEKISSHILNHVHEMDVDSIILDFTALSINDFETFNVLANHLDQLTKSLKIMGLHIVLVGFTPDITQKIVHSNVSFIHEFKAFSTFRNALQFLMKKKGIAFKKI